MRDGELVGWPKASADGVLADEGKPAFNPIEPDWLRPIEPDWLRRVVRGRRIFILLLVATVILAEAAAACGGTVRATVNSINASGVGSAVGTVTFEDTKWGLLITPDLFGLPAGVHGFHIHQNAACGVAENKGEMTPGFAAGGHYDPQHTGKHLGPYNTGGHEGDLPPLLVDADGKATLPVLAPRLTAKEVSGHSVMIHAGPDNYSDSPKPLGGGGARIACGVIQ